ncbi:MAG: Membrane protein, partial [uncultured Actinomycetospora sp.]
DRAPASGRPRRDRARGPPPAHPLGGLGARRVRLRLLRHRRAARVRRVVGLQLPLRGPGRDGRARHDPRRVRAAVHPAAAAGGARRGGGPRDHPDPARAVVGDRRGELPRRRAVRPARPARRRVPHGRGAAGRRPRARGARGERAAPPPRAVPLRRPPGL